MLDKPCNTVHSMCMEGNDPNQNPGEDMKTTTVTTLDTGMMTTNEIADLTGKRHKNVMRDYIKQCEELGSGLKSELRDYVDSRGKTQACYAISKRDVQILITGYSIPLRAKVIDRLDELEKKTLTTPLIPSAGIDISALIESLSKVNGKLLTKERQRGNRYQQLSIADKTKRIIMETKLKLVEEKLDASQKLLQAPQGSSVPFPTSAITQPIAVPQIDDMELVTSSWISKNCSNIVRTTKLTPTRYGTTNKLSAEITGYLKKMDLTPSLKQVGKYKIAHFNKTAVMNVERLLAGQTK